MVGGRTMLCLSPLNCTRGIGIDTCDTHLYFQCVTHVQLYHFKLARRVESSYYV